MDLVLGTVIDGRYRIEQLMGSGGMAQVYRGTYLKTGVKVAIKLIDMTLSKDVTTQRRSIDEARAMMELQSSHVVRAIDVGSLPSGQLYIIMEHLDGEDLDALLVREGPLPWPRVADIAIQICSGLATAHRRGIIHRDIKPQNCFQVLVDDNPEHIKIIDFGVARDTGAEAGPTQQGFLIGTPEYTAPELVLGVEKANPRTDIYALGVTLYKLLTGVVPFRGSTPLETLRKHVAEPLVLPSRVGAHRDIPQAADDIIARALARNPYRRFASAEELSRAIKAAFGLQGPGIMAPPQSVAAITPSKLAPPPQAETRPRPNNPSVSGLRSPCPPPPSAVAAPPRAPAARLGPSAVSSAQFRSVDRRTLLIHSAILLSLTLLFMVGTIYVSPREPVGVPAREPEDLDPEPLTAPPTSLLIASEDATNSQAVLPAREEIGPKTGVMPVLTLPTAETGAAQPAPSTPAPGASGAGSAHPPKVDEAQVPPAPETGGKPQPERNFNYKEAKKQLDDQADYLRKTCLARASRPTARLKLRVDVRANGWPITKIFASDRAVRTCVRELLVFPFDPSPRGGAFEYAITDAGDSSFQKLPLDPAIVQ